MKVGVPKETNEGERRVALVPDVVRKLSAKGLEGRRRERRGRAGAHPGRAVHRGRGHDRRPVGRRCRRQGRAALLRGGRQVPRDGVLIGFLAPRTQPETIEQLKSAGVTAFAMEAIPRISRAQSMDALSSQSNVAGYKAALLGAEHSTRFYPMLMTAAGTIPPAKVLVLGGGVAGLQALATARTRQTARCTTGYDVRPRSRAGAVAGRQVARPGHRRVRRGRLRPRADRRGAGPAAAGDDRRDQGLRRGHHHGARPRAPAP